MRLTRLYYNLPLVEPSNVELSGPVHHHLAVVLRAKLGDQVVLFNGDGFDYYGVITEIRKKSSTIALQSRNANTNDSELEIHLGQCISANTRFDIALQKATELGVNEITPIISERSNSLPKQQWEKRLKHWQQITIAAAEQSHRNKPPIINTPLPLAEWVKARNEDIKWLMSLNGNTVEKQESSISSIAILIGPEGGFHEQEEQLAVENQFVPVTFGPRVLRTETAAMLSISMAQYLWGDAG